MGRRTDADADLPPSADSTLCSDDPERRNGRVSDVGDPLLPKTKNKIW